MDRGCRRCLRASMKHAGERWLLAVQLAWLVLAVCPAESATLRITTPYSLYICPEGQHVTMTCKFSGTHNFIYTFWYFNNWDDTSCSEKKHIRNISQRELHESGKHHGLPKNISGEKYLHGQRASHHGLETSSDHHGTFRITMANLTLQDSGYYCCYVVEAKKEHNKVHAQQDAHGFMELRIQKANGTLPNCTLHPAVNSERENITAAALATGACVVGILCLPLILLLIYKQRQAVRNRRAQELVRLDSSGQGIENPVFDAVPVVTLESKPTPQLTYMASRHESESGRHLLSEPDTPLSPPGPGDCFFPSLEPVPDSPNLVNV